MADRIGTVYFASSTAQGWGDWGPVLLQTGTTTPGAPVTAVLAPDGIITLFLADPGGVVWTTSGNPAQGQEGVWNSVSPWTEVSPQTGTTTPGAPLSAVLAPDGTYRCSWPIPAASCAPHRAAPPEAGKSGPPCRRRPAPPPPARPSPPCWPRTGSSRCSCSVPFPASACAPCRAVPPKAWEAGRAAGPACRTAAPPPARPSPPCWPRTGPTRCSWPIPAAPCRPHRATRPKAGEAAGPRVAADRHHHPRRARHRRAGPGRDHHVVHVQCRSQRRRVHRIGQPPETGNPGPACRRAAPPPARPSPPC